MIADSFHIGFLIALFNKKILPKKCLNYHICFGSNRSDIQGSKQEFMPYQKNKFSADVPHCKMNSRSSVIQFISLLSNQSSCNSVKKSTARSDN